MRNVIGNAITLTLFGESHGPEIGVIIDGVCPGIKIDYNLIDALLSKRRPHAKGETKRIEKDSYRFSSGIFNGYTTGMPITIVVKNENINSSSYEQIKDLARPSHADYVANIKYHGYNDYNGGGHFSGRLTTPLVIAGAIFETMLLKFNIKVGCHIKQLNDLTDVPFNDFEREIDLVNSLDFPTISNIHVKMQQKIEEVSSKQDSIGGIIETAIINLPVGLGEPTFSSLEGELSKAMFSIGAIKGIEFGLGFDFATSLGSEVNDQYCMKNGKVQTITNNNGGINGGISNSMPIVFNCVVKPTPSIYKTQKSIHLKNNTIQDLTIIGRHDSAIIRRINVVIRSMSSFVIADMLALRYGTDIFLKEKLGD